MNMERHRHASRTASATANVSDEGKWRRESETREDDGTNLHLGKALTSLGESFGC